MRTRVLVLTALALASVAAPVAVSQTPDCNSFSVALAPESPPTTGFEAGESRTLILEVQNSGQLDGEVTFTLDPPPSGQWQWPSELPPVQVASGAAVPVDVNVRYLGVDDGSTVDLIYHYDAECSGPLQVASGSGDGSMELSGVAAPGASPGAPDDDGSAVWPWILLALGGVVLVGVVFVSTQTQRGRVAAEADEDEKTVTPGRGTSFPVTLTNRSGRSIPLKLEVSDVPGGWSALTALPELTLGPKEERTLWVMVRAPDEAETGGRTQVTLEVKPEKGKPRTVELTAIVGERPT